MVALLSGWPGKGLVLGDDQGVDPSERGSFSCSVHERQDLSGLHPAHAQILRQGARSGWSSRCLRQIGFIPRCDGYYGAAAHPMQADRRARQRKPNKHPEL